MVLRGQFKVLLIGFQSPGEAGQMLRGLMRTLPYGNGFAHRRHGIGFGEKFVTFVKRDKELL
ncbi:MAG: hypothetical protein J5828_02100 [Desulfovibrionaceae bacterium]|nr:hypothetical protein [Desulfovibrionaceae bacterium]